MLRQMLTTKHRAQIESHQRVPNVPLNRLLHPFQLMRVFVSANIMITSSSIIRLSPLIAFSSFITKEKQVHVKAKSQNSKVIHKVQ
jgi:hypothetical protein